MLCNPTRGLLKYFISVPFVFHVKFSKIVCAKKYILYVQIVSWAPNKKILDSKEAEGGTFFQSFYVGLSAPAGCLEPRAHFSRLHTYM